jgi:hypothetical protein
MGICGPEPQDAVPMGDLGDLQCQDFLDVHRRIGYPLGRPGRQKRSPAAGYSLEVPPSSQYSLDRIIHLS